MHPAPRRSRSLTYSVSKLSVIRSAIGGYQGGAAIVRELIQNADDAGASYLGLTFTTNRLTAENDSVFSERDFQAISSLASGNKRYDADVTGTWGTGFLSVYQLCDYPELHSAGAQVTFDPASDELPILDSSITNHTLFHFPWRQARTEIAREIEAGVWTPTDIAKFEQDAAREIYRSILFLRNLKRLTVEVDDGTNRVTRCEVRRQPALRHTLRDGIERQRWEISAYDQAHGERIDVWHVYRRRLAEGFVVDGAIIKRPDIAFAHGPEVDWQGEPLSGWLYNTLPTEIRTGAAFQINGDFFPDANRRDIHTEGEKGDWNRRVIQGIADLFAESIEFVRDDCGEPDAFYRLFPLGFDDKRFRPITDAFEQRARVTPIVWTSDKRWTRPSDARLATRSLKDVVEDHLPSMAPPDLEADLRAFFKRVGARDFGLAELLGYVGTIIQNGTPLAKAPPILQTREQLDRLWSRLEEPLLRRRDLPQSEVIQNLLKDAPVLLDAEGNLRTNDPKAGPWRAGAKMRSLLPCRDRMLEPAFQERHDRVLIETVENIDVRRVVGYLAQIAPDCAGRPIANAHEAINSQEKLRSVLDYLIENQARAHSLDLRNLVLCLDEDDVLHPIGDAPWLVADEALRAILDGAALSWMHPTLRQNAAYAAFLHAAGTRRLDAETLIDLLAEWFPARGRLTGAPPPLNDPWRLCKLYAFFHRANLGDEARARLMTLPIVLTQQGFLSAADDGDVPLSLPPGATGDGDQFDDVLRLDSLVSDRVLTDDTVPFFSGVLQLERLNLARYVSRYVPSHYLNATLTDEHRLQLLRLVWKVLRESRTEPAALLEKLRHCRLIHCADGQYRCATEVYVPSDLLDGVFPNGYPVPHPAYNIPKQSGIAARSSYTTDRSLVHADWWPLFHQLGMRRLPSSRDLIQSIHVTIGSPPAPAAVEHIGRVYRLIADQWDALSTKPDALSVLRTQAWLPAKDNDEQWFKPDQLYAASLGALVESQAPVIPFGDIRGDVAEFLGLKTQAEPGHVVQHLLWLSERDEELNPRIYAFLADQDSQALAPLKHERVVYDMRAQRWWLPRQTFFGNYSHDFGSYRCYLNIDDLGRTIPFFRKVGVRDAPDAIQDSIDLLREIGETHHDDPLPKVDRLLVHRAWQRLASAFPAESASDDLPRWIQQVEQLRCVLDRDNRLRRPNDVLINDRPRLAEKFIGQSIPYACFDEDTFLPLLRAIGTRRLSSAVDRRATRVSNDRYDDEWTQRVRVLEKPLRRIVAHFRSRSTEEWPDLSQIGQITVYQAGEIRVQYVARFGETSVHGVVEAVDALFDQSRARLYRRAGTAPSFAIARELISVLSRTADPAILLPILERVIEARLDEVQSLLDRYEIDRFDGGSAPSEPSTPAFATAFATVPLLDTEDEAASSDPGAAVDELSDHRGEQPIRADAEGTLSERHEGIGGASTEPAGRNREQISDQDEDALLADTTIRPTFPTPPNPTDDGTDVDALLTEEPTVSPRADSESAPRFTGPTRPIVPSIPTNWNRLRAEFSEAFAVEDSRDAAGGEFHWDDEEAQNAATSQELLYPENAAATRDLEVTETRFVLTFQNRYQGFLPLTTQVQRLLHGQPDRITCQTDFNVGFDLFIDRAERIIYNQDALPRFFDAQGIPAGGVVYLRRVHGNTFHLYYNRDPHIVRNVRISDIDDDGSVNYTIVKELEVLCESDDFVVIAEKRLEDQASLFLEAVGKKSVFETIIDLFESVPGRRMRFGELIQALFLIRRVAVSTVRACLDDYPCFVHDGDDIWRFVPERGFGIRRGHTMRDRVPGMAAPRSPQPPPTPSRQRVPEPVTNGDDAQRDQVQELIRLVDVLSQSLKTWGEGSQRIGQSRLRLPLRDLEQVIAGLRLADDEEADPARVELSPAALAALPPVVQNALHRLARNAGDETAGADLRNWVSVRLAAYPNGSTSDALLVEVLCSVGRVPIEAHVQAVLEHAVAAAITENVFERARALTDLIEQTTEAPCESLRERIDQCEKALEWLELARIERDEDDALTMLREALTLNPYLDAVREHATRALTALLTPLCEAIDRHLAAEELDAATTMIQRVRQVSADYLNLVANPGLIEAMWTALGERVLNQAHTHAQSVADNRDPQRALAVYYRVAQLYACLPEGAQQRHATVYLDTLDNLGHAYDEAGETIPAIACWTRAVDFWLKTLKVGSPGRDLIEIRWHLAEAWERVGLWTHARDVWSEVVRHSSGSMRTSAERRLGKLLRHIRTAADEIEIARRRFAAEGARYRDDEQLTALVTIEHFDRLIT